MSPVHRKSRIALLSAYDKTGLIPFAKQLLDEGFDLLSSGGTARELTRANVPVREVSDYTGFPEMMHGRVKTLHPKVHGGILAIRDNHDHIASMREHGIESIELVVVNLYPFEATIARDGITRDEAIEQIDIGGPSMVRSGAKNHKFVGVVVDPGDYARVAGELMSTHELSSNLRWELAVKAFGHTAKYDQAIATWLAAHQPERS